MLQKIILILDNMDELHYNKQAVFGKQNIVSLLSKLWRSRLAWSRAHDWKSCNGQKPFEGSNPSFSAKEKPCVIN